MEHNKENKYGDCSCCYKYSDKHKTIRHGGSAGIYFVAFIGAAVYYIQQATSFGVGIWGIIKALTWPAVVVYHLLRFLSI